MTHATVRLLYRATLSLAKTLADTGKAFARRPQMAAIVSDFFALVAGRFERHVTRLLKVIQIDVAVGVVEQTRQVGLELGEVGSPGRVRVPAARHEPVELGSAVVGSLQTVAVLDPAHHFARLHSRVRRRA